MLSPKQLWVNPDCGFNTREWHEVRLALENMVKTASNAGISGAKLEDAPGLKALSPILSRWQTRMGQQQRCTKKMFEGIAKLTTGHLSQAKNQKSS
jgi:cobalamin-independent methionine synthase catalytic subunit